MIPKIIHYCWFGGKAKPKIVRKCIKSWQKYCPDYKLVEWNETNFDIACCRYVKDAYTSKKWAFVSDYCRFWILKNYGGIYLDTDVELLKPVDEFLKAPFVGFESPNILNPGLILGCECEDKHCSNLIDEYENDKFILDNGTMNMRTVCHRMTDEFVKYGLKLDNSMQQIDQYIVYPQEYFNPCDETGAIRVTDKTVSIHHFAGSWVDKKSKFRYRIYKVLCKLFGKKCADKLRLKFKKK